MPKDPKPKFGAGARLNHSQIAEWNKHVDASPEGQLEELFAQFKTLNPKSKIGLAELSGELEMANQQAKRIAGKTGTMMKEVAHVGNRFPEMNVNGKNLGATDGSLRTAGKGSYAKGKGQSVIDIPSYVSEIEFDEVEGLPFYKDKNGDIVYTERSALGHPRFKKKAAQGGLRDELGNEYIEVNGELVRKN